MHCLGHQAHAFLLVAQIVLPSLEKLLLNQHLVVVNDFLVASAQILSHFDAHEPFLGGSLAFHEPDVLLKDLFLDSESSQNFGHLFESRVCFAEVLGVGHAISSDVLLLNNSLHLVALLLDSALQVNLGFFHLHNAHFETVFAPSGHCLSQKTFFRVFEELFTN